MNIEKCLELNASQVLIQIEETMASPHYNSEDNFLYYPSGKSSLLLCAHVDTVRKEDKPLILKRERNIITAEQSVLGADDRAGVWALLEIRRRCIEENLTVPAMLFTNHEESGGMGMVELVKAQKKYFKNIHLAIAMDRKGMNEYVTYNHLPVEVSRYMESFGYIKGCGTFNDVTYFTSEYRIPSVNVSVGYYNAHMVNERLHLDELLFSISRMMEIIRNPIGKRYKTEKEVLYDGYDSYWYGYGDTYKSKNRKKRGGNGNVHPITATQDYIYHDVSRGGNTGQWCVLCEDAMGVRYVDEGDCSTWVCDECYKWVTRDTYCHDDYDLYRKGV